MDFVGRKKGEPLAISTTGQCYASALRAACEKLAKKERRTNE
jgi:hypothetical protein